MCLECEAKRARLLTPEERAYRKLLGALDPNICLACEGSGYMPNIRPGGSGQSGEDDFLIHGYHFWYNEHPDFHAIKRSNEKRWIPGHVCYHCNGHGLVKPGLSWDDRILHPKPRTRYLPWPPGHEPDLNEEEHYAEA